MNFSIKVSLLFFLIFSCYLEAQIYTSEDTLICRSKFNFAINKNLENEPIGDVIASIGKSFIGSEYLPHTLENDSIESLVINLTGLDCTTFLENTLALAICIKQKDTSFSDFTNELTKIRYRNGLIDGYSSRLNYFSDWIFDNEKKKILKNISGEIGGIPIKFDVNYMSTHPDLYRELKLDSTLIPEIKNQETEIAAREYFYIPKSMIKNVENKINDGDLIAFTSGIKGLDINHVGIAIKGLNGKIQLLHAPALGRKVQITPESLSDYIAKVKKDTGIIVMRAVEVSKN